MMDKIDYWFLDTAVEELIGFSWIVPYKNYGLSINRRPLDLNINEITKAIHHLIKKELLAVITSVDREKLSKECHEKNSYLTTDLLIAKSFIPSQEQIRLALNKQEHFFYFLTKQGGKEWESVSFPKWNQYHYYYTEEDESIIYCTDLSLAREIMQIEHLLDFNGCHIEPILATERWEIETPWYPTYWKRLPFVYIERHQVKCTYFDEGIENINEAQEIIDKREQARKWYNSMNHWHTNYFEE
jgi:hypothetical protein